MLVTLESLEQRRLAPIVAVDDELLPGRGETRISGNLKDPKSRIRRYLARRRYNLLKPELSTDPKCYYIGLDLEVK